MADTFYAIFHDFVFEKRIIKSNPSPTLATIHRLLEFYHTALATDSLRELGESGRSSSFTMIPE